MYRVFLIYIFHGTIDLVFYLFSFSVAPPLTVENVMAVVKRVRSWRTLAKRLIIAHSKDNEHVFYGSTDLDDLQRQHSSDEDCLKEVVELFLQGKGGRYSRHQSSWRCVLWCLLFVDEIQLAYQFKSYSEHLEGECLCSVVCDVLLYKYKSMQVLTKRRTCSYVAIPPWVKS